MRVTCGQVPGRLRFIHVGDGDQAHFEALLGLFQLAFERALLGLGGRQVVLGAQYQQVGFDDPDDQVLLVGGKGGFRFLGDFLAGLKAEPGRQIEQRLVEGDRRNRGIGITVGE